MIKDKIQNLQSTFKELTTTVLIAYNISRNLTKKHLNEIFSAYGQLQGVYIPKDEDSKLSKNYAYIEYLNKEDAEKAMLYMGDGQIDGLKVRMELMTIDDVENNQITSTNPKDSNNSVKNSKNIDKIDKIGQINKRRSRSRSRSRKKSISPPRKRIYHYHNRQHQPYNRKYGSSKSNERKHKKRDSSSSSSSESSDSENSSNKSSSSS